MAKRHKSDTKTFAEETYAEQSKTINAGIVYLEKAIKVKSEGKKCPKKRIKNLEDLIEQIKNNPSLSDFLCN